MELKTKRLILRELCAKRTDIRDIVEHANDLDISKWLLFVPYPYTIEAVKKWVSKAKKKTNAKERDDYTFAIELKENGRMIGAMGIHRVNDQQKKADF